MWLHSQTRSGHRDARAEATGRPRRAQQTSCTPWVHTKITGAARSIAGIEVLTMASAAFSRSLSCRHGPVAVAESSPARIHCRAARRSSRPGRRTSRIRVSEPALLVNTEMTSGSIPAPAMASIRQGPGCSSRSQRRVGGAEPAKGSARSRAASAQRKADCGRLTPQRPGRRAAGDAQDQLRRHPP